MQRFALGLDLGQTSDYSALSLIRERERTDETLLLLPPGAAIEPAYDVPYLRRWDLGTPYPAIVADTVGRVRAVVRRERGAPVSLVVDGTGVGRPVVDLLAAAMRDVDAELVAVIITGGTAARFELRDDGAQEWHVPKKFLVGAMQVLLQSRRLNISPRLADAAVLQAELAAFRMKFTQAANAQYEAWREGDHDDLVLATALPCWAQMHGPLGQPFAAAAGGERHIPEVR